MGFLTTKPKLDRLTQPVVAAQDRTVLAQGSRANCTVQAAYSPERGDEGQGQACPASPKLTNQMNHCSSPASE